MKKVDILAIGAHPDDIELGCGGTLFKHIKKGYTVGLCDLTQGELGSRGSAEIRVREAERAKEILGAKWRVNLKMPDGFFTNSKANILKIAKVIRQARPKVILTNAISDRHPDHGRAAKIVSDAIFFSGLRRIEIFDNQGNILPYHKVRTLLHFIQDREIPFNLVVDISEHMDDKIACVMAYKSQFYQGNDSGPQTPISGKQFLNFLRSKNAVYGRDIQVDYAEAFIVQRNFGIDDLMEIL